MDGWMMFEWMDDGWMDDGWMMFGWMNSWMKKACCLSVQVIEVLVRAEQGLFREVVKHLNQVEEQVLESLAWTGDSPLWESLRGAKDHAPSCQEVRPCLMMYMCQCFLLCAFLFVCPEVKCNCRRLPIYVWWFLTLGE